MDHGRPEEQCAISAELATPGDGLPFCSRGYQRRQVTAMDGLMDLGC